MTTKNDYVRPEFVTKLSEWQPEIFFYPGAEIYHVNAKALTTGKALKKFGLTGF
jgi:hypothetical protein